MQKGGITPGGKFRQRILGQAARDHEPELKDIDRRRYLLRNIVEEKGPVAFLFSGLAGSGKSHVINWLQDNPDKDIGPTTFAERWMPRTWRTGDAPVDKPWIHAGSSIGEKTSPTLQHPAIARVKDLGGSLLPAEDRTGPDQIAAAYRKYKGYYGFPLKSLWKNLRQGNNVALIVGDLGKIAPFHDAVHNNFPLIPTVNVRLDVPIAVLEQRLSKREEAHPGEVEERVSANMGMGSYEIPQAKAVRNLIGLLTLLNIAPEEIEEAGLQPGNVNPLDEKSFKKYAREWAKQARAESSYLAGDILAPRRLDYKHGFIPDEVVDVLANQVTPAAERENARIVLKGGIAAALYGARRPASLDIDWAVREGRLDQHRRIMKRLGVEGDYETHWQKATFHSDKISGKTQTGYDVDVSLDAIATSRVQPHENGFCYEFPLDGFLEFHRRDVLLPKGRRAHIVPPEMLLVEKLVAGRGRDLGKFDLLDSLGILTQQPISLPIVQRLIDQQQYDPKVDRDIRDTSLDYLRDRDPEDLHDTLVKINRFIKGDGDITKAVPKSRPLITDESIVKKFPTLDRLAKQLHDRDIHDPRIIDIFIRKLAHRAGENEKLDMSQVEKGKKDASMVSPNFIKRLSMIDRMVSSLEKMETSVVRELGTHNEIEHYGGEDATKAQIDGLRTFLYYYTDYQLGRDDVYVRRSKDWANRPESQEFFADLDAQRDRLTKLTRNNH